MKKLKAICLLSLVSVFSMAHSAPSESLKAKMQAIGTVKKVIPTESNNIYAWLYEKNGKTLVLYNTPDEKFFFEGSIYKMQSKELISNKYIKESLNFASPEFRNKVLGLRSTPPQPQAQNITYENGLMNLKWKGSNIPEALSLLDSMSGVTQGKGKAQDTLYVFYDPRCPWCHRTFNTLQDYIKKGYTVKWLPTVALGKTDEAFALASAPLQNPKLLTPSFDKTAVAKKVIPTKKNLEDLNANMQFLVAYFNKVEPDQNVSVPFGIMLNKENGKLTHIQGLTEKPILELVFGPK